MTEERIFAIQACKELENNLSNYGFKTNKKGLKYKRKLNKDITQEIYFEISRYFEIRCSILVKSKKIKKWNIENNISELDTLFGRQIGYLTPLNTWKTWQIMKSDIAKSQFHKELLNQLEKYILPFLDKFNDIDSLINEVVNNGGKWTKYDNSNFPIPPLKKVIALGTLEKTQKLLDNFSKKNRNVIKQVKRYKIDKMDKFNFNHNEFVGAQEFKIAFANGLKLK